MANGDKVYKNEDLHLGLDQEQDENECWISEDIRGKYYLDHRCGEWVIGTKKDVLRLIEDLKKLIEKGEIK